MPTVSASASRGYPAAVVDPCSVCGARSFERVRDRHDVALDVADTESRGHQLMLRAPADLDRCGACGTLQRDPATVPSDLVERYAVDEYDGRHLVRLHRSGTTAMLADLAWLRHSGLEPDRHVAELGSYAGALLSAASRVGCRVVGIDVGAQTSTFARARGFDVVTGAFDDAMLSRASLDGVFVMNCFEQLPDARATLRGVRRAVRRGGSLLVRTPNADYVASAHRPALRARAARCAVLGAPFVRCFSPGALVQILRDGAFVPVAFRGRHAPWMEVVARAA